MRIAFVTVCAFGHILPSLPIISELVKKGVEVDYFATRHFKEWIEKSGANFVELPDKGAPGDSVENDGNFVSYLPLIFLGMAEGIIDPLMDYLKKHRPDAIISDSLALAGRLASSRLNIPRINIFTTYASYDAFAICRFWPKFDPASCKPIALGLEQAKKLQNEYGGNLLTLEEIFDSYADYNIATLTKSFQVEGDKFPEDKFFFAGAQISSRYNDHTWKAPDNGKPLLYTSLGSLFNNWPEFYSMLFKAVKGLDINVVCSIGNTIKAEDLGAIPENVVTMPFTPQLEVLSHADYFFTHCGIGSVMEAMYFGVPCFCLPQMDEQEFTASRLVKMGIASGSATRNTINEDIIRENLLKLINDPSYKNNALKQQQEMKNLGGPVRAADAVIRYINSLK